MAALKENINEMIATLRKTPRKNTDQDWLKTNIAKFTRMVQGQRDLLTVARPIAFRVDAAGERTAQHLLYR